MKNNFFETILGALVLIVAGVFLYFSYISSSFNIQNGYTIKARFDHIDGIATGNDVRIAGVKIGSISQIDVDPKKFQAIVSLNINPEIKLPDDTSAEVMTEGFLGGKYINISPGGSEHCLKENEYIDHTQSSVSLEQLIGKFMFTPSKSTNEK
jgi:phospholipid/cholesterol/gamma-HCH transport system substrate-binding protein